MSVQKNLTAFFKPLPKKRTSTEAQLQAAESTSKLNDAEKRRKLSDCDSRSLPQETDSNSASLKPIVENIPPEGVRSGDLIDCSATGSHKIGDSTGVTQENDSNLLNSNSSPNSTSEKKIISSPFGMLTHLQCLAKVKSQCSKTPVLHPSIGPTWFFALHAEFQKPYFHKLSDFVVQERQKSTIYPAADQVWTWTTKVPIKDVKVVILGQDPYHNPGQAHGLCFSVPKGVNPPPSLLNMYKELSDDIPGFSPPSHGYLDGWAQQGVLLLNACLTVRANSPNSHKDRGWEQLTDAVIKYLSDNGRGLVFLLWGSYAQKKGSVVDKKKHHILKTVHPSPLSAHRGFFGSKHFSQCNDLLKKSGKKPVDWSYLP